MVLTGPLSSASWSQAARIGTRSRTIAKRPIADARSLAVLEAREGRVEKADLTTSDVDRLSASAPFPDNSACLRAFRW
jgi:hypothetical protein